jgi:predicted N-formylglutamate amidohydrolase
LQKANPLRDKPLRVVVTCEHGGNRVPKSFEGLFRGREGLLEGHRGYDPGALSLARTLARALDAPIHASTVTRLLVDVNRSPHNPGRFSEITRGLGRPERESIESSYSRPYREALERALASHVRAGRRVLHLSVHTFTPALRGKVRASDIGLLYDPSRALERALCRLWKGAIRRLRPDLRCRSNYPYLGTSDGLTAYMRKRFPGNSYMGVELEVNQCHPIGSPGAWPGLKQAMVKSLLLALEGGSSGC